jgi:putative DNA primase/helicase
MSQEDRVFFQVPFDDKDDAKALGARFDGTAKKWYAPDAAVKEALASRWPVAGGGGAGAHPLQQHQPRQYGSQGREQHAAPADGQRVHYDVPFDENQTAKALGARFDGTCKKWCANTYSEPLCARTQRACGKCFVQMVTQVCAGACPVFVVACISRKLEASQVA